MKYFEQLFSKVETKRETKLDGKTCRCNLFSLPYNNKLKYVEKKDFKTLLFDVWMYSASVLKQITSNSFENCKKNRESLVS